MPLTPFDLMPNHPANDGGDLPTQAQVVDYLTTENVALKAVIADLNFALKLKKMVISFDRTRIEELKAEIAELRAAMLDIPVEQLEQEESDVSSM
jgi:hypothetical protein